MGVWKVGKHCVIAKHTLSICWNEISLFPPRCLNFSLIWSIIIMNHRYHFSKYCFVLSSWIRVAQSAGLHVPCVILGRVAGCSPWSLLHRSSPGRVRKMLYLRSFVQYSSLFQQMARVVTFEFSLRRLPHVNMHFFLSCWQTLGGYCVSSWPRQIFCNMSESRISLYLWNWVYQLGHSRLIFITIFF